MIDDPVLRNDWHVVAESSRAAPGVVLSARLLGQDLVLWRTSEGVCAWQDLCLHRGAKLSGGRIQDNCLICPYHGWNYDAGGRCVRIPRIQCSLHLCAPAAGDSDPHHAHESTCPFSARRARKSEFLNAVFTGGIDDISICLGGGRRRSLHE